MGVKIDVSQIDKFQQQLKALNAAQRDQFMRSSCVEGANRLIALVKPLTPVDHGTLRAGWDNAAAKLSANGVTTSAGSGGTGYSVDVENAVPYASYVEYGHRQTPGRYVPAIGKRLTASWVEGRHMLETAEGTLQTVWPPALKATLEAFLRTVL